MTSTIPLSAAGSSWRWQLRDSKGQWVEMGSEVKWLAQGVLRSGRVTGSPSPGVATVRDDDGNEHSLSANRLTAVTPDASTSGPRAAGRRRLRGLVQRKTQKAQIEFKQTPAMEEAMHDMADIITTDVAPKDQDDAFEATSDVIVGKIAERLPKAQQALATVKALKERGTDAQIRLAVYIQTQSRLDRLISKATFWAQEYLGDVGATDNPTPSWGAIPTLIGLPNPYSHPTEFLVESGKMISQLLKALRPLVSAGDSWRWQLRDRNGRWIEMGSEVKWLARGRWLYGIVVGSPAPGVATVEEAFTAIQHDIPSARLTVVRDAAELINRVEAARDEKGRIDWRALDLGARSPLPPEVTARKIPEIRFDLPKDSQRDAAGNPIYLYRAVSEEDWQNILKTGHIKSDARMNLVDTEGTVAADRDPTWYLPNTLGSQGRVLRIKFNKADGWWLDTDGYWKTPEKIPLDRVDAITPLSLNGQLDPSTVTPKMIKSNIDNEINNALIKAFPNYDGRGLIADFKDAAWAARGNYRDKDSAADARAYIQDIEGLLVGIQPDEYSTETPDEIRVAVTPVLEGAKRALDIIEPPKILPEQITAADLKPGDVYRRKHDNALVRVISVIESDSDYMEIDGIVLTGDTAGARTQMSMMKPMTVLRQSDQPQDFEKDVLAPVRERLDALKVKYPDGMAAAIDVALTAPPGEPPEMSDRLKELGRDVEVVRWMYDEAAARDRLNDLEAKKLRGEATNAQITEAEDALRALHYDRVGGKIRDYNVSLLNYQFQRREWSEKNRKALEVITPHSDQAKEILGEVREIGKMVRLGIEVDIAQRSMSSPEVKNLQKKLDDLTFEKNSMVKRRLELNADDPDFPVVRKRLAELIPEVENVRRQLIKADTSLDPGYGDSMTLPDARQQTKLKRRRELARRAVATLAGTTTKTKQTWVSKEPAARVRQGEVHRALTDEEQDAMTAGLLAYPASWVERFDQNIYTTSMSERGWHTEADHHITLSMTDQKKPSEDGSAHVWSTILHEQGHGMEQVVPGLGGLEAMFWHDRMGEDSGKLLHSEDGARFPDDNSEIRPSNVARPTPLRYTLKVYGNVYSKKQRSWEVFTTGVEEVLGTGKTQYTVRGADADLWEFTMGALLTLDGREKRG